MWRRRWDWRVKFTYVLFLRIPDLLLLTNTYAILLLLTYVTMFCFTEARMRYPRRWWRGTSTSPSSEYPRSEQRRITSDHISHRHPILSLWIAMHEGVQLNWTGLNRTDSTLNLCIGDSLSLLIHLSQRKRWVKEEEQRYTILYCTILYYTILFYRTSSLGQFFLFKSPM